MKSLIVISLICFSSIQTPVAHAGESSIVSISWQKSKLDIGSHNLTGPTKNIWLKIKVKDSDGICGVRAFVWDKAKRAYDNKSADLMLTSGSSETGTWQGLFYDFDPRYKGLWIVTEVELVDCLGRNTLLKNFKTGLGGPKAKLNVSLGKKTLAKISVSTTNTKSQLCDVAGQNCTQTQYVFTVVAKNSKNKPLAGATIMAELCGDLRFPGDENCGTESSLLLGKTDATGKLNVSIYPGTFFTNDNDTVWRATDSENVFAKISVVPTKSTAHTRYAKTIAFDNTYCFNSFNPVTCGP